MHLRPNNSLLLWYLLLSSFILPATNEVGMTRGPILQTKKLRAREFLGPTQALAGGNRGPGFEFLSFQIQSVQSKVHKNRLFFLFTFEVLLPEILIQSIFDKNAIIQYLFLKTYYLAVIILDTMDIVMSKTNKNP